MGDGILKLSHDDQLKKNQSIEYILRWIKQIIEFQNDSRNIQLKDIHFLKSKLETKHLSKIEKLVFKKMITIIEDFSEEKTSTLLYPLNHISENQHPIARIH